MDKTNTRNQQKFRRRQAFECKESSRFFISEILKNNKYFFKFWLQLPEKIKRWFDLILNCWVYPIFEFSSDSENIICYKVLSPLKVINYFLIYIIHLKNNR